MKPNKEEEAKQLLPHQSVAVAPPSDPAYSSHRDRCNICGIQVRLILCKCDERKIHYQYFDRKKDTVDAHAATGVICL